MTAAESIMLNRLIGKCVRIEWTSERHDWPYFKLCGFLPTANVIELQGMDYPDGSAKHDGDFFTVDWREVRNIEGVMT